MFLKMFIVIFLRFHCKFGRQVFGVHIEIGNIILYVAFTMFIFRFDISLKENISHIYPRDCVSETTQTKQFKMQSSAATAMAIFRALLSLNMIIFSPFLVLLSVPSCTTSAINRGRSVTPYIFNRDLWSFYLFKVKLYKQCLSK